MGLFDQQFVFAVPTPSQVSLAKDCTLDFGQIQEVAVSITQVKYLTHSCKPSSCFQNIDCAFMDHCRKFKLKNSVPYGA